MAQHVEGRNAVVEALKSGRALKVWLSHSATGRTIDEIVKLCKEREIPFERVANEVILSKVETENHQGVLAETADLPQTTLEEIIALEDPFVVILDHIQDPHNLGAIIRTAEAAGVDAVIIADKRAATMTAGAIKASAGAVEYIPIMTVANIAQTIEYLKKGNIWIVGTADEAEKTHTECDLRGRLAIVIGSEGEGLSRLVRDKCDFLVRIPMKGKISSLNASVAAGVILYEAVRQRY